MGIKATHCHTQQSDVTKVEKKIFVVSHFRHHKSLSVQTQSQRSGRRVSERPPERHQLFSSSLWRCSGGRTAARLFRLKLFTQKVKMDFSFTVASIRSGICSHPAIKLNHFPFTEHVIMNWVSNHMQIGWEIREGGRKRIESSAFPVLASPEFKYHLKRHSELSGCTFGWVGCTSCSSAGERMGLRGRPLPQVQSRPLFSLLSAQAHETPPADQSLGAQTHPPSEEGTWLSFSSSRRL